jgi:hypothetical protein
MFLLPNEKIRKLKFNKEKAILLAGKHYSTG